MRDRLWQIIGCAAVLSGIVPRSESCTSVKLAPSDSGGSFDQWPRTWEAVSRRYAQQEGGGMRGFRGRDDGDDA